MIVDGYSGISTRTSFPDCAWRARHLMCASLLARSRALTHAKRTLAPPPFSPPPRRMTPATWTPSSRSARAPCYGSGAGTRTRRRGPLTSPALGPRQVSSARP